MDFNAGKQFYDESQALIESDVMIRVTNLTVWTPEEKSWWRRKPTKHKNIILNNVSGYIKRNEFAAVIGPSGAGKTTFMVSLAGKCTLPSSGKVTLQGRNVKECPGAIEIVPQFETFMDGLSVMEHLIFMTEMKLGSYKDPKQEKVLKRLMNELKIESFKNTPITALSGGERRLLSLACSLLSDPQILICDEPTTGLDSYNALLVVGVLKNLSYGRLVICSIHQPSCDLFKEFNSILLMSDGKLLFHGTKDECKEVFESIGLYCPLIYNPAEFYIKAVSDLNGNVQNLMNIVNQLDESEGYISEQTYKISRRNWFKQVHLLLWRLLLSGRRHIKDQLIEIFITVVLTSIVIGGVYGGTSGTTQRGIQDMRGCLWLISSENAYGISYSVIYTFQNEIALFKREVGIYGCSAYFVSRVLSMIPRCIVWPILLVSVATCTIQLPNHIVTIFKLIVALSLSALPALAYGLGMASIFTSSGLMADVMPCVDQPFLLMSGAVLSLSSLPHWLYPFKYMSHFYYAMDAVSNVYWRQIDNIECSSNATTACIRNGADVLSGNGYSENYIMEDLIGFSIVTAFWLLVAYFGLKREQRKGYAY